MCWTKVITFVGCLTVAWWGVPVIQGEALRTVAGTYAQVASTMLGFLITALAILTAMINVKLLANMRKSGHYDKLVKELVFSCVTFLAVMVVCLVALLFSVQWVQFVFKLATGLMAFSVALLALVGRKFYLVISSIN